MSDFKPWFFDPKQLSEVYRPSKGATLQETHVREPLAPLQGPGAGRACKPPRPAVGRALHSSSCSSPPAPSIQRPCPHLLSPASNPQAVVLVGYNLTGGYFIAQNSWGPRVKGGKDQGLFRVAFGAASVGAPEFSYGVTFTPLAAVGGGAARAAGPGSAGAARPSSKCAGGLEYSAAPGDFLSGVAWRFGVPLPRLLLDNVKALPDLDAPLAGNTLLVCGAAKPGGARGARAAGGREAPHQTPAARL
jgi:hypothetical protein